MHNFLYHFPTYNKSSVEELLGRNILGVKRNVTLFKKIIFVFLIITLVKYGNVSIWLGTFCLSAKGKSRSPIIKVARLNFVQNMFFLTFSICVILNRIKLFKPCTCVPILEKTSKNGTLKRNQNATAS